MQYLALNMRDQHHSWTFLFLLLASSSFFTSPSPGVELPRGHVIWWGADRFKHNFNSNQTNGVVELDDEILNNAVAIAATTARGMVVNSEGSAISFGDFSQLGDHLTSGLTNVTTVAVQGGSFWAIRRDGTVVQWGGDQDPGNIVARLSNVTAVVWAGYRSYLALRNDGTVLGFRLHGEGEAAGDLEAAIPVHVGRNLLTGVIKLAPMGDSPLILRSNGMVFSLIRQVGETPFRYIMEEPVVIAGKSLEDVTSIAAGGQHALALKTDGTIVAWGANLSGETVVPPGLSNVIAMAAAEHLSVALKRDGTVAAWGGNFQGQTLVPLGLSKVIAIASGGWFGMALTTGNIPSSVYTYPHGRIEQMEREADVIFKGLVISTTSISNNMFPYWAQTHATRFHLVSILKGDINTNELVLWHVTHGPDAWGGGSPPSDHQIEVGKSYLVFARRLDRPDYLYTPPADAKDRPLEFRQLYRDGVTRTLDTRPVTNTPIKALHWAELNLLLNDPTPSNQLYAIKELDRFSKIGNRSDDWAHADDFKRRLVLEALHPAITGPNDDVAVAALQCFQVGSRATNTLDPHIPTLVRIADSDSTTGRRVAAISAFIDQPYPAISNALPRWLRDSNDDVRAAAIVLLPRYSGKFQEQALMTAAQDPSAHVRGVVADAIGDVKLATLLPVLENLFTTSTNLTNSSPYKAKLLKYEDYSGDLDVNDVHTSAGLALLRFEAAQIADILKTNLNDADFHLRFLCKLSEQNAGPWLEDMAQAMDQWLESERQKSLSWGSDPKTYRPELSGTYFGCWRIICNHLKGLPYADFANGKMDRYFNTLEQSTGSGSQQRTMLYELYKMKGLNKRAKAFREQVARQDSWHVQFLDKIDAEYQKNGAPPGQ